MKTPRLTFLFNIFFLVLPFFCAAQKVYSVEDVPNVRLSSESRFVSNPDGILSAGAVNQIDAILYNLYNKTSVEVAVVVLSSIGNDTPEDFAVRLFQRWGIGKKGQDNGLLILLVTDDRYIRFEVGYGLEGILTDAISKRIQSQRMNFYLAQGDWDNGMIEGVKAVNEYLTDPDSDLAFAPALADDEFTRNLIILFISMMVIMVIALLASKRKKRCPRCNSKMEIIDQQTSKISSGVRLITTIYRCPNCGYTMKKNSTQNVGGAFAGGFGGGMLGGGLGRGIGGGGGSWGGGRSGGGGATSRF